MSFLAASLPEPLRLFRVLPLVRTFVMMACFHLRLLWRIRSADMLHVFTASGFSFLWVPAPSLAIARAFGKKCILHYHDGRAETHLREWRTARPLILLADVVVAPSEYLVDIFRKYGIAAKSVYNFIDPEAFRYRERGRPRPIFLHNRRLEKLYNLPCMFRAFAIVQSRYPQASLTVAHDGPLRRQLQSLADELGLRRVYFVGEVDQRQTVELYDRADIFWMCPDFDCMPVSVLESFASGLPVIATNAGGIPYIVDHERTGLLVNRDDPEAMARAAFRLLEEDHLASRMAAAGRQELSKYEWNNVRPQWLAIYAELMAEPT